jgi:hypothetical protein
MKSKKEEAVAIIEEVLDRKVADGELIKTNSNKGQWVYDWNPNRKQPA